MRYIIPLIILAGLMALLAVGSISAQETWRPPATCDDDDRAIPGNRMSPCKLETPTLTAIEYTVEAQYPYCATGMNIHMDGFGQPPEGFKIEAVTIRVGQNHPDTFGRSRAIHGASNLADRHSYSKAHNGYFRIVALHIGLQDRVEPRFRFTTETGTPVFAHIVLEHGAQIYSFATNYIPYPAMGGQIEAINSCLAELEQEASRRKAQAEATIAAQELQALRDAQARILETETLRTEALVQQLAHEEARAAILREIVRIRLGAERDRAQLLNKYLERVRLDSEAFDIETSEIEDEINRYLDFNSELLEAIRGYHETLQTRIADVKADLNTQRTELEALQREAEENAIEETPTPEP